jgi:hypothetical protein
MLVTALRDEVDARRAHADESAAELRKPVAEAVKGDGDILVAYAARSPWESRHCAASVRG